MQVGNTYEYCYNFFCRLRRSDLVGFVKTLTFANALLIKNISYYYGKGIHQESQGK